MTTTVAHAARDPSPDQMPGAIELLASQRPVSRASNCTAATAAALVRRDSRNRCLIHASAGYIAAFSDGRKRLPDGKAVAAPPRDPAANACIARKVDKMLLKHAHLPLRDAIPEHPGNIPRVVGRQRQPARATGQSAAEAATAEPLTAMFHAGSPRPVAERGLSLGKGLPDSMTSTAGPDVRYCKPEVMAAPRPLQPVAFRLLPVAFTMLQNHAMFYPHFRRCEHAA